MLDPAAPGRSSDFVKGPTAMAGETPATDPAVVEARLAEVVARFGDNLTPEQREQVRARIERTLQLASALRTAPLGNADEPESGFAPYRGDA